MRRKRKPTPEQEVIALACKLFREALPFIPGDAPLRWYKNDALKDQIRLFLAAFEVKK